MAFQIGFCAERDPSSRKQEAAGELRQPMAPKKSVVQVRFPQRGRTLAYYNDQFDLHPGDAVYVEGKLAGMLGWVVEVSYNFKIKLSDYKRVLFLVDTEVHGQFFPAGTHVVSVDREAIPAEKAARWFLPPSEEEAYAQGNDDTAFPLDDLKRMKIGSAAADRGFAYYQENRVRYISVDGSRGYAIVEGSRAYEVEFTYSGAMIQHLTCSCFCGGNCKHQFAAMLQLQETLEQIEKTCGDAYRRTGYFAAVLRETLFSFAVAHKAQGSFTL